MKTRKKHKVTVGELIEKLAKNNWKNQVYVSDDTQHDFVLEAVGNIGKCYEITAVSSHSGDIVTVDFESKEQVENFDEMYALIKQLEGCVVEAKELLKNQGIPNDWNRLLKRADRLKRKIKATR